MEKAIKKLFLLILFLTSLFICACTNPWMTEILEPKTITFDTDGGDPVPSQNLYKGEKVKRPANPKKEGYSFIDWYWYKDSENFEKYDFNFIPRKDMTLYAKWDNLSGEEFFTVTFDSQGGSEEKPQTVKKGAVAERPPNPNKSGFGFVNWYDNSGLNDPPYNFDAPVLKDITLYAKWSNIFYTVTFIDNEGKIIDTQLVGENGSATQAIPPIKSVEIAAGLYLGDPSTETFDGWYKEGENTSFIFSTPITGDITLYARWKPNFIDFSNQTGNSNFEKAISYVNGNPDTGAYTLILDTDATVISGYIDKNTKLTIQGLKTVNITINGSIAVNDTAELTINDKILTIGNGTLSITSAASLSLSGKSNINNIHLYADTNGNSSVNIASDWTGSVSALNLCGRVSDLQTVIDFWNKPTNPLTVLKGDGLNAATAAKFTLGNFIPLLGAATSQQKIIGYKIEDSGINIGKLVKDDPTFNSSDDFAAWLASQPANTAAAAYSVKLNVSDLGGNYNTAGSTGYVLRQNSTKYVNLDLSGSSITTISSNAFQSCTSLTSINIPSGVTSIGSSAFYGCSSLTSVTIPNGVSSIGSQAFQSCTNLIDITIPSSVTSIGQMAFQSCTSLTSVTIPSGVTNIENSTFAYCSNLTNITIPSSVTSFGTSAFQNCSNLSNITIPNSVTSIGDMVFANCTSLSSITIPSSVTSIGYGAFNTCTSLTSVTIPSSVTSIGGSAFNGCSNLNSVTFESAGITLASGAFNNLSSLQSAYTAGGIGTYIRSGSTWTKQ